MKYTPSTYFGKAKVAMHTEHVMKRLLDKYSATHEEQLPRITSHVLRHTFCLKWFKNKAFGK